MIKKGVNPYFVKELQTGYVVIGDFQSYRGYTVFLCKQHCTEIHQLETKFKENFLLEMAEVAEAVFKAFKPDKLNYELLGNTDAHLHWHLIPRRRTDEKADKAIWAINEEKRSRRPTNSELNQLKSSLLKKLS
ncbi:MAG: HIT family protein [Thermodesulfobacteriota bacterium]